VVEQLVVVGMLVVKLDEVLAGMVVVERVVEFVEVELKILEVEL
jgi:hypothetical protein